MTKKIVAATVLVLCGIAIGRASQPPASKVYELRTYTAAEGKFDAVNARFRDHTVKLFEKHGMKNVGYWTPMEGPTAGTTLIYILEHQSRDAARASWAAFSKDPDWQKAKTESEVNGRIVAKVESVFLTATDYSPIKYFVLDSLGDALRCDEGRCRTRAPRSAGASTRRRAGSSACQHDAMRSANVQACNDCCIVSIQDRRSRAPTGG